VKASDAEPLFVSVAEEGVDRLLPWPGDRPWNFVLHNGGGLRIDLHFYEPLGDGSWQYGGVTGGKTYPAEALAGSGAIAGTQVRCESALWPVRWHSGYPLRAVDHPDVSLLCERFGIELPERFRGID
jgi:lincosamide nucleotidyltransferase A/C/D/E